MQNKYLIAVVGPTAVGKTTMSIKVAAHFGTEIISADSRQLFKEISIGTAKPTPEEMRSIRHHFIDSHSLTDHFSAGDFEVQGIKVLEDLFRKYDTVVLTGGTGLYVKGLTEGFDDIPDAKPEIREMLNYKFKKEGISALLELLYQYDPEYLNSVDKNNPQRIIRALEVSMSAGVPYSTFRKGNKSKRKFTTIKIGLDLPREILYEQINQRVDIMINQGLINEVKSVEKYRGCNALNTVGYQEVFDFFDGKTNLEETIDLIKRNTRRYAKRQLTWFRKDQEIQWFRPDQETEILYYIKNHMSPGY